MESMVARTLLAFAALAAVACSREQARAEPPTPSDDSFGANTTPSSGADFALVELFSSEGCSSCPPADASVAALPERVGSRDVFVIAWHVDYWDSLGWPDPYAAHEYTQRQYAYAKYFGSSGVYTPELVLDGAEYTGARAMLEHAIAGAAHKTATMSLAIDGVTGRTVSVRFDAHEAPSNARLVIVLTERGVVSRVTAGENTGRTLSHEHVARAMKVAPALVGTVAIQAPPDVKLSNASVVAFAELASFEKVAAARVPLAK